jgi:hypothetical protein
MKLLLPVLLLLPGWCLAGGGFTVLPDTPVFPDFPADALCHQLSLSRITDSREWIGAIGLAAPLLQWGENIQAGAGATVFNRIVKTPGHITVSTVDYRVDFPVDARIDSFAFRAAFGHMSCHFADDGIEQLGRHSISSVRDYLSAAAAWHTAGGYLYSAVTWNYHNEPLADKRWHLQLGGTADMWRFSDDAVLFAAVDLKVKEEVHWGSTQSYQVGARLFEHDGRSVSITYTHRRGFEERGQVYAENVVMNLVGVVLDVR